jgi:NAD(P)-dependent dehydrogenase (short-subunit alcohol dehydrogenase family)
MDISGIAAIVTGGASGLGAATATRLASAGAKVAILDANEDLAAKTAQKIGAVACAADVTDEQSVQNALVKAREVNGDARILVNCAGIAIGTRTLGRDGPHPLGSFEKVIKVNLIGTFNCIRLFAAEAAGLEPMTDGERGVIVNTASVAAFEGQIGQVAYAASKGGVVGLTLPVARDLSSMGIRVCTIAPGLFLTPMMQGLPQDVQDSLGASVPFPKRLGTAEEYAQLATHIVENRMLNGETIRLDGALRMAPK